MLTDGKIRNLRLEKLGDFNPRFYTYNYLNGFEDSSQYCIRLTSSNDQTLCRGEEGSWLGQWKGDVLELLQNGEVIHLFQKQFTDEEKCLSIDEVDIINDVFQLRSVGTDGVSIALIRPLAT